MEFSIHRTVELLSATPDVLDALLSPLSVEWIKVGTHDDWGPADIIGHLIHCEEADWIPRARIILEKGTDEPFEPLDRYALFAIAGQKTLNQLLSRFAELRRKNLATLASWQLTDEQLDRQGTHPEFGNVTLRQLLATWAVHDLTHMRQISTVLAKQYETAVGPWKAYTTILQ